MAETVSFAVDFETKTATSDVQEFARATDVAFATVESSSTEDLGAVQTRMNVLSLAFEGASQRIESALRDVIRQQGQLDDSTRRNQGSTEGWGIKVLALKEIFSTAAEAVGLLVRAGDQLIRGTTEQVVQTDNYARALGISTQSLQGYQFAIQRAGGDTDALREAMRTAQEATAEFVNAGSGPAVEAFQILGVQLTDASGRVREIDQLFPDLVRSLGSVSDEAERTRLAIQLFGEEDSVVIASLAKNPEAFDQARAAAERYGVTVSQDLVEQSRQFQSGLTDALGALQGLGNEIVEALLPSINALLPQFAEWVASLRESDTVQQQIIPTLETIIGYLGNIGTAVETLQQLWRGLNIAFNLVVSGILEGVGFILQGLGTVLDAAARAADFLGFEGVAAKVRSAAQAVNEVGQEADMLGDAAAETAAEWSLAFERANNSTQQSKAAVQQTTTAQQELQRQAATTGQAVVASTQQVTTAQQQAQAATIELNRAYQALGIQGSDQLKLLADRAIQNFNRIEQSGKETPERIQQIWEQQVVPKIIAAYGKIPPEMERINTGAVSGLDKLLADLGIKTRQELESSTATARQQLQQIVSIYGTSSVEAQQAVEALGDKVVGVHGELPPNIQRIMDQVRQAHEGSAEGSASAHEDAANRIGDAYQQAAISARNSAGIMAAGWGEVEGSLRSLPTTLEGLIDLQRTLQREALEANRDRSVFAVGLDEFYRKQIEQVNDLIHAKRDEMNANGEVSESLQSLNDRINQWRIASLQGEEQTLQTTAAVQGLNTAITTGADGIAMLADATMAATEPVRVLARGIGGLAPAIHQTETAAEHLEGRLSEAFAVLGVQSTETLRTMAVEAIRAFQIVASSGVESGETLAIIWAEQVVPAIIEGYGELPPAFEQINDIVLRGANNTFTLVKDVLARNLSDMQDALGIGGEAAIYFADTLEGAATATRVLTNELDLLNSEGEVVEAVSTRVARSVGGIGQSARDALDDVAALRRELIDLSNGRIGGNVGNELPSLAPGPTPGGIPTSGRPGRALTPGPTSSTFLSVGQLTIQSRADERSVTSRTVVEALNEAARRGIVLPNR